MSTEDQITQFFENILNADYGKLSAYAIALFVVFWGIVCWWVYTDISNRTKNKYLKIASVVIVALLNILGLIIYFIIRPKDTWEELYWADLERRYLIYETADLGDCENCGYQLRPGFTNCPQCGFAIKAKCSCGALNDKSWKFCPYCGAQMEKKPEIQPQITVNQNRPHVSQQNGINVAKTQPAVAQSLPLQQNYQPTQQVGQPVQKPVSTSYPEVAIEKAKESDMSEKIMKSEPKYVIKGSAEKLFHYVDLAFDKLMAPFNKKKNDVNAVKSALKEDEKIFDQGQKAVNTGNANKNRKKKHKNKKRK